MEIPCCEKRHTKEPLGNHLQMIEIVQIILPRSRVNNVLTKLHSGPSGGHSGVNKTLNKVQQRHYWLQARSDVEK
jgi:hypothetical protein